MIYIQLLSGVKLDDMDIQVSEDGNQLKYPIRWSDVILQPSKLLSKYIDQYGHLEYQPSHTMVVNFVRQRNSYVNLAPTKMLDLITLSR